MSDRYAWVLFGCLSAAFAAQAETVLFNEASVKRIPLDVAIPSEAITDGDLADREISLWVSMSNPKSGWTWAIPTRTNTLYLTDGAKRYPLLNPTKPEWGDTGPLQPGAVRELRFPIPPDARAKTLRLCCPSGAFLWGGSLPGPLQVELWKGIRCSLTAWVDAANRNAFIDASQIPGPVSVYTFKLADGTVQRSDSPYFRKRLPEKPVPFTVEVEAVTHKDGVFRQTVTVTPHAQPLTAPLPVEKILVGQCVYGDNPRFRDEIITNRLANLLIGWSKATDYTNLPPAIVRAAAANDIHFMTIYGHGPRPVTDLMKERLGSRYLWNNIGEFAGYLYQGLREAKACNIRQGENLESARNRFINRFIRNYVIDQHRTHDFIFSTSGSPLGTYELQGGMDFMCCELYAVGAHNLAYATSEMRGAARKWKPEYWGGWLAEEWQTFPVPYDSRQKYDLLKAGLYQQYLMGTSLIVLESGAQSTQAQQYTAKANNVKQGYDDPAPANYRKTMKEFFDWTQAHPRAKGTPETPVAFVLGNNDAFVGMDYPAFAVWGQHENAATNTNWKYDRPEKSWIAIQNLAYPMPGNALKPYPNSWLAGSPFGQTDVINIDTEGRLSDLTRYKTLIYVGWNTMAPSILTLLADYVRQGGNLLLCVPHCSTRIDREHAAYTVADLIRDGDLSPLIPVKIRARNDAGAFPIAEVELPDDAVKVIQRSPEGLPLALEYASGKGSVRLLTPWLYPGLNTPESRLFIDQARTLLERTPRAATLSGDDRDAISYAVYGETVYLLNIDCVAPRSVTLHHHGRDESLTFAPCEMKILQLKP